MNTQVHQALGELQDALRDIHQFSHQLQQTQASTDIAAKAASQSASKSVEYQELLKQQVQESLGKLDDMAQQLLGSVSQAGEKLGTLTQQRAQTLAKDVADEVAKIQGDIHSVTEPYESLSQETQKLVEYLKSVNFPARLDKLEQQTGVLTKALNHEVSGLQALRNEIDELSKSQISLKKTQLLFGISSLVLLLVILIKMFL